MDHRLVCSGHVSHWYFLDDFHFIAIWEVTKINIYSRENQEIVKSIKFCLNWNPQTCKLLSVKYSVDKELYKVRMIDYDFGGRVTVRLEEKFVRHAMLWLRNGGKWWQNPRDKNA